MKQILTISALLLILVSCNEYKDEEGTPLSPGILGLQSNSESNSINGLNSTEQVSQTNITLDLGKIQATRELGFLLTNQGETSIFDVVISSSNSSFAISPTSISELKPLIFVDNQSRQGLIPLINLTIMHGISPSGIGLTETLPAGINNTIIAFEGKTLNGSDTVDVELAIDVIVSALIMDIQLKSDGEIVDLTKPLGSACCYGIDTDDMRLYKAGSNHEIENTGNVKIFLTVGYSTEIELNPSEVHSFTGDDLFIKLDGQGTVTDYNRIHLHDDGSGYLYLTTLN
ncbi:MAG: hypothetical protein OCD76_06795 [Reichenbachiella sp.]